MVDGIQYRIRCKIPSALDFGSGWLTYGTGRTCVIPLPANVSSSGYWNWGGFDHVLPNHILQCISTIIPPNPSFGPDTPIWRWEDKRVFTTKSAYDILGLRVETENSHVWKAIWSHSGPQRIRLFLWLVVHGGLLTNVERSRHLQFMWSEEEDVNHILRVCTRARMTWLRLLSLAKFHEFMSLSLHDWIARNICTSSRFGEDERWSICFAMTCWQLWKRRCSLVFSDNYVDHCIRLAHEYHTSLNQYHMLAPEICPPLGWIKVNVVGVVDRQPLVGYSEMIIEIGC
ncbi:hypothetical protein V6N11_044149 [Hibiscus sabdariffa]|uniref:Reverse transcriptase zinc-binding domain-containing protein n=1 Tax=Hibiscus sabdariffa TaxID=183260 RepID=A0ABR2REH9_9ROSI